MLDVTLCGKVFMGCGMTLREEYGPQGALICCSNAAARCNVDERTSWRDPGEIVGKSIWGRIERIT
jgi:hypothetical protein